MKIEIRLHEDKDRLFSAKRIYIKHPMGNFFIDIRDIIDKVREKLSAQLKLERIAQEYDVDVSQFYENAPRPKVKKV